MLRKSALIFLLLVVMNVDEVTPARSEMSIFSELRGITSTMLNVYRMLNRIITDPQEVNITLNGLFHWIVDDADTQAMDAMDTKLTDISSQLDWMLEMMEVKWTRMEETMRQMPLTVDVDTLELKLAREIRIIRHLFDDTLRCLGDFTRFNRQNLEQLEKSLTGRRVGGLRDSLLKLYDLIVPESAQTLKPSILDLWSRQAQSKGETACGDMQSPNQKLYNFHKVVVITELMGQVALTFGYYLQRALKNVTVDYELKEAQEEQTRRLTKYFRGFKCAMKSASLSLRPCDPPELKRDETYIEMEKLYRAVVNYNITNPDSCRGSCKEIDEYAYQNQDGILCTHLYKCWPLNIKTYYVQPNELRRYEWIEDTNGAVYGKKNGCQGTEIQTPGRSIGLASCEMCICTCVGGDKSRKAEEIQAFSLRPSRSNTTGNMVVTGMKFSRYESIICIRIKQGKLLPGGEIDQNSESWTDCDLSDSSYRIPGVDNSEYVTDDFIVMIPPANNIDLDEINQENDTIVTGIKFGVSNCTNGTSVHIMLQLEYTKFNFSTGELGDFEGVSSSSSCHTQKIRINDTDSPLNAPPADQNIVDPNSNRYVAFEWSDFHKDAGQTTLPLLDAQPVETKPSAPLSGAGLFYKASRGYGGFLALKIHTLNYGRYMNEEMVKDDSGQYSGNHELYDNLTEHFRMDGEKPTGPASPNQEKIHTHHARSAYPFISVIFLPFIIIVGYWIRKIHMERSGYNRMMS